jgi:hypothetical protein
MLHRVAPVFMAAAIFLSGAVSGQEENAELTQARVLYEKDVEFATKPIRDRYASRLESLKRSLGARGDARGAAAVQDEIDRIREMSAGQQAFSKVAGTWKVTYSTGNVRIYTITPEGVAVQKDYEGRGPRTTKLVVKGGDVLLDFDDNILERLHVKARALVVEHYNPKTLYPAGQPNAQGTGALVAGRKE